MDYPIWDFTLGGGMLMALMAIPHVIVSHFVVLLVACLATVGYMVKRVLESPASGSDAV